MSLILDPVRKTSQHLVKTFHSSITSILGLGLLYVTDFFRQFSEENFLQTHGTVMGTKWLCLLPIFSWRKLKRN